MFTFSFTICPIPGSLTFTRVLSSWSCCLAVHLSYPNPNSAHMLVSWQCLKNGHVLQVWSIRENHVNENSVWGIRPKPKGKRSCRTSHITSHGNLLLCRKHLECYIEISEEKFKLQHRAAFPAKYNYIP